jgi:predicted porin
VRYSINNNVGVSSRQSSEISYTTPNMGGVVGRLGYETKQDGGVGSVVDMGVNASFGPIGLGLGYIKQQTKAGNYGIHASYDLGAVKLMAGHAKVGAGGPDTVAVKGNSFGFTAPIGAVGLFGEISKSDRPTLANGAGNSAMELGADYNLSKRTALTGAIAKTKGLSMGYYAGIRHSF